MPQTALSKLQLEAVAWLLKPLALESRQGFRDRAVVGGLSAWRERMQDKLVSQAGLEPPAAERLLEPLAGYADLNAGDRQARLAEVQARLAELSAPRPAAPPAPAKRPAAKSVERAAPPLRLDTPVQYIRGVGPERARALKRLGIEQAGDLLRHFPRAWQDRSRLARISDLTPGQAVTVAGRVKARSTFRIRRSLTLTKIVIDDGTGLLTGTWFNQPYMRDRFCDGQEVLLYGRLEMYRGWQIANPDYEIMEGGEADSIHTNRIVPMYPAADRLSQRVLRQLIYSTVQALSDRVPEILPAGIRAARGFQDIGPALRHIHFPDSSEALKLARQRLVFEELFLQQLAVLSLRAWEQRGTGPSLRGDGPLVRAFRGRLPFALTGAQQRVQDEIFADLARPHPMHRLLQGDVGSGKTILAVLACLASVDSGHQAAVMAPTEVLATQHYLNFKRYLDPLGVNVELLISGLPAAERKRRHAALRSGEVRVAVGTHALTEEGTGFHNLGLAVVDEQHRFGVEQRAQLRAKGDSPHMLVMTATPIPRTLAMTAYGDLDVSVLDELPPGRHPVRTRWLHPDQAAEAYAQVRQEVGNGRQAYIVFPVIEESEKLDVKSLTKEFRHMSDDIFAGLPMGLLHGRLSTEEKETVMAEFKAGRLGILASTTVIEVGVDVPNATVMLIENGERFGLAQLHQLRGRIGRGTSPSACYVISDPKTDEGKSRMELFSRIQDGFRLAEEDLALRGPGEFLGIRQSGLPDLKLANLVRDAQEIAEARKFALQVLAADPDLAKPENAELKALFQRLYLDKLDRARAG